MCLLHHFIYLSCWTHFQFESKSERCPIISHMLRVIINPAYIQLRWMKQPWHSQGILSYPFLIWDHFLLVSSSFQSNVDTGLCSESIKLLLIMWGTSCHLASPLWFVEMGLSVNMPSRIVELLQSCFGFFWCGTLLHIRHYELRLFANLNEGDQSSTSNKNPFHVDLLIHTNASKEP